MTWDGHNFWLNEVEVWPIAPASLAISYLVAMFCKQLEAYLFG
jgi:hypothetical protein